MLTNKVVNAIVILTRKVVNLLVGRWGTENSGTFDAARGPFGPTHAGRKEEKGRRQNAAARSFKTYQDISGGMNIAIIQSFKGVPFQTGHQPDGTGKAGGGVQADYQPD